MPPSLRSILFASKNKAAAEAALSESVFVALQDAGSKGATTRELGELLRLDPARVSKLLLRYSDQIAVTWVPFKTRDPGGPVQVAHYTIKRKETTSE